MFYKIFPLVQQEELSDLRQHPEVTHRLISVVNF